MGRCVQNSMRARSGIVLFFARNYQNNIYPSTYSPCHLAAPPPAHPVLNRHGLTHLHLPPSAPPAYCLPRTHLLSEHLATPFPTTVCFNHISYYSSTLLIAIMASLFPYQHAYSHNSTMLSSITPTALHAPFYHTTRPNLLPFMSDKHLSLAAPVLAYWLYSFFFHFLNTARFSYFEKRRIHDSPEVLARNKVTVTQVIKAVILQHVIQTVLGIFWLEDDEAIFRREVMKDHLAAMSNLSPWVADGVLLVLGRRVGEQVLKRNGEAIVRWMYWWGIPALQMLLAL